MRKLCETELCTGCGACASICPVGCIEMKPDDEGFLRPCIDVANCNECNLCGETCPILGKQIIENNETIAYAAINLDEEIRYNSTSGGIFTLLCQWVLHKDGIVFGASYDEYFNVVHCQVDNIQDLYKLRGAKYAQSNLGDTFKRVQAYLDKGKYVLFSGTPCQVGGLKAFLGKEYSNLLLVDLICHGAPSPKIWQKYIEYRANIDSNGIKPSKINLRSKESGWPGYSIRFDYPNGEKYSSKNSEDPFLRGFVGNLYLRPSCYNCNYKGYDRQSDFTLGDYWGVWDQEPEFHDGKGTSLVLLHTDKAKNCWNQISNQIKCKIVDLEESLRDNPSALVSSNKSSGRQEFLLRYENEDFTLFVKELLPKPKTTKKSLFYIIKCSIRKIMRFLYN